jgi:hypothetical protein
VLVDGIVNLQAEVERLRQILRRIPTLECGHCGDVARWADAFWDSGDEEACDSCGFPGAVHVDSEIPFWRPSEELSAHCKREDCEDEGCLKARGEG